MDLKSLCMRHGSRLYSVRFVGGDVILCIREKIQVSRAGQFVLGIGTVNCQYTLDREGGCFILVMPQLLYAMFEVLNLWMLVDEFDRLLKKKEGSNSFCRDVRLRL